jgi:peptide/nickel transport system substrate-binding protein
MKGTLFIGLATMLLASCHAAQTEDPNTLVMAIDTPPITFDPRGPTNANTARVQHLLFHTLVQKNDRFEFIPQLAERWEAADDAKTYTFHLRPGVKFHDGKELTARDVVYTFESLIAPGFDSPKRAAFSKLQRVEAKDASTVVFSCRESYPGLLVDLIAVGIIPENSGQTVADRPIGTGPFQFESYIESQEVSLSAFPNALDGGPKIERLKIKVVRDATTLSLELLSGSVHLALNTLLSPDFTEEQRRLGTLNVVISEGAGVEYLGLNTSDSILDDVRVRQAIAYAIDRRVIIDALLRGQARPASSVLPASHWAYNPTAPSYEYNPNRARQLLDEAGFPDPDGDGPQPRLRLSLKTSSAEYARQIATILQEQLRLAGIAVELQSLEFQTYLSDVNRGQYQLFFLRLVGGNQFPDIFKAAFGSRSIPNDPAITAKERTGFLNRARYRNPELDQLIAQAEATKDRQEQVKLYARIQEILASDAPWIYLWYPANVAVMSQRVGHAHIPVSGDFFFIKDLTFAETAR